MWNLSLPAFAILLLSSCAVPTEESQTSDKTLLEGTWMGNCFESYIDGSLYYLRETIIFRGSTFSSLTKRYEEVSIWEELEMPEEEVPEAEEGPLEPSDEEGVPLEDFSGRNLFRFYQPNTSLPVAAVTDHCKIDGTPVVEFLGTFSVLSNALVFEDKLLTQIDAESTPTLLPVESGPYTLGIPIEWRRYFYIDGNIMYPTDGGGFDGEDAPVTMINLENYWVRQL